MRGMDAALCGRVEDQNGAEDQANAEDQAMSVAEWERLCAECRQAADRHKAELTATRSSGWYGPVRHARAFGLYEESVRRLAWAQEELAKARVHGRTLRPLGVDGPTAARITAGEHPHAS